MNNGHESPYHEEVTVMASSPNNAKSMIESQYGKGCILTGPFRAFPDKVQGYSRPTGAGSQVSLGENVGKVFSTIFGIFLLIGVLPLAFVSYFAFEDFEQQTRMHPLFAGLMVAIPVLFFVFVLYKVRIVRYVYFGAESVGLAYLAYTIAMENTDQIWSWFIAVVVLAVCLFLTHLLGKGWV